MHRAHLSFQCPDAERARLLRDVLDVEASEGPEGSSVTLRLDGSAVHAHLDADRLATLRAAINSVARQADIALRTLG